MDIGFIIQNKEILRFLFTLSIGLICFVIVLKTHRLFKISLHQGIRYFRNAFFFYGLAFILRYLLGSVAIISIKEIVSPYLIKIIFEFFLIIAGFSLFYSLIWKKFGRKDRSSLFNTRFLIFYLIALIIVILDYLWNTYLIMFISQAILFSYALFIAYSKSKENKFSKLYLKVILLSLFGWILNLIASFFAWNQIMIIIVYIINLIIFLLFLYEVIKTTKK